MYELAKHPADIGRLIDSGIKLFRHSFSSVFLIALAANFLIFIPEVIGRLFGGSNDVMPYTIIPLLFGVLGILVMLVYLSLYAALILKTWTLANQQQVPVQELITKGFSLLLPIVIGSILFFLACLLGMILLIIPGIYLSVALCFYYFAIVIDAKEPIEALKYSYRIIKGYWWRTLFIMLIPAMIAMILYFIVAFVGGILAFILTGFATEGQGFEIVIQMVTTVAQACFTPLYVSMLLVVYHDLKLRTEDTMPPENPLLADDPVVDK